MQMYLRIMQYLVLTLEMTLNWKNTIVLVKKVQSNWALAALILETMIKS